MTTVTERLRWIVGVALVAIFSAYGQTRVVEARAALPSCESECNSEASCGTECEYPAGESWVFTTCGAYNGGGSSYCDGNTCEDMCGPHAPGGWECYDDFTLSSCYDQDNYAECDDGVCGSYYGAESPYTCEEDCGPPPPDPECGDSSCDPGESWMTCWVDCPVPPPNNDVCGNGDCESTESEETCSLDCMIPKLSCTTYSCPYNYQCVSGSMCVHKNYVYVASTCDRVNGCGVGYTCQPMEVAFGGPIIYVCMPLDPW